MPTSPIQFASIGSGSQGNCSLVRADSTVLMVDCGFTLKKTVERLSGLGIAPETVSAIVVTHEHSDHIKGVGPFARRYKTPVYMTSGTYMSRNYGVIPHLHLIKNYMPFSIENMSIDPIPVPHDAREPAQFRFRYNALSLGMLTDLGSISDCVLDTFSDCDALLVEANHDLQMLAEGPYPPSLRARVASAWGHLNNRQTAYFLDQINLGRLQHLVLGHISQKNNSMARVKEALQDTVKHVSTTRYACQDMGFDWLTVE